MAKVKFGLKAALKVLTLKKIDLLPAATKTWSYLSQA